MKKNPIKIAIISAIIGGIIGAFFTVIFDKSFEFVSKSITIPQETASDLATRRKIAYTYEYKGHYKKLKFLFFPLSQTGWSYKLKIANLSSIDLTNIQIQITCKKETSYYLARSSLVEIYSDPENKIKKGEPLLFKSRSETFSFIYPLIPKNYFHQLEFAVFKDEMPTRDDLEIKIITNEGKALLLTPKEFSDLGWKKS